MSDVGEKGGTMETLTEDQLRSLAMQAAGAASVPFMRDHPTYVMPTEDIKEGVERVLKDGDWRDA